MESSRPADFVQFALAGKWVGNSTPASFTVVVVDSAFVNHSFHLQRAIVRPVLPPCQRALCGPRAPGTSSPGEPGARFLCEIAPSSLVRLLFARKRALRLPRTNARLCELPQAPILGLVVSDL